MLVSENRPEWLIADLAIMAAGCVTVPTYTTNTERDHQHILDDSGARAVIVSTQKLAKTLLPAAIRSSAASMSSASSRCRRARKAMSSFHDWAALIAAGDAPTSPALRGRRPISGATTSPASSTPSGTGGAPRGVMQHHGAILHNVEGCADADRRGFRLGRRGLPLLPPRQPRL